LAAVAETRNIKTIAAAQQSDPLAKEIATLISALTLLSLGTHSRFICITLSLGDPPYDPTGRRRCVAPPIMARRCAFLSWTMTPIGKYDAHFDSLSVHRM